MALFDINNENERIEDSYQKYGEFSAGIRKILMSKNLAKPANIYDVFYNNTRKEQLAKNQELFQNKIDNSAETIRKELLAKNIVKIIMMEEEYSDFRKQLLSRNKLHESSSITEIGNSIRGQLLSKNENGTQDLEKKSESFRGNNLSKNLSDTSDLLDSSESARKKNVSTNGPIEQDSLQNDSDLYRNKNSSANIEKTSDLQKDSNSFRNKNVSQNLDKNSDVQKDSISYRQNNLSKNNPVSTDLEKLEEDFRKSNLSNNIKSSTDLENFSKIFRNNVVSKNIEKTKDLEELSQNFRQNSLSQNVEKTSDLEKDSSSYANNNLSKNVEKTSDLEKESEAYRIKNTSPNVENASDLQTESNGFRNNVLSKNIPSESDLEKTSYPFIKNNISKNVDKQTDILIDSESFKKNNLSKNESNETDLEKTEKVYRDNNISKNVEKVIDLQKESEAFLKNNISKIIPKETDLEKSQEGFRNKNESQNNPKESDLEKLSESFRKSNLSNNIAKNSDLLSDSEQYEKNAISNNTNFVDDKDVNFLESGSNDARNNNISKNSDFIDDKDANLLESGSNDARDNNISKNSDFIDGEDVNYLQNNSDDFRDNNISKNSDFIDDSEANFLEAGSNDARDNNISKNSTFVSELDADYFTQAGNSINSHTTPGGAFSSGSVERKDALSKNSNFVNGESVNHLLPTSSEIRKNLISQNDGGLFGVFVSGLGTGVFLGVSRVLVQGLLYRNLLKLRNRSFIDDIDIMNGTKESIVLSSPDNIDARETQTIQNKYKYYQNSSDGLSILYSPFFQGEGWGGLINDTVSTEKLQGKTYLTKLPFPNDQFTYGYESFELRSPVTTNVNRLIDGILNSQQNIQSVYGNTLQEEIEFFKYPVAYGKKVLKTDSTKPKGIDYLTNITQGNYEIENRYILRGTVTDAIYKLNLSRNAFQPNSNFRDAKKILEGLFAQHPDLLDLVQKALPQKSIEKMEQEKSVLTLLGKPYIGNDKQESVIDAFTDSEVCKTVADINPLEKYFNKTDSEIKGVRRIIDKIRNSTQIVKFGQNFIIGQKEFVVGTTSDGQPIISKQRYGINTNGNTDNVYRPKGAETLLFSIKNYANSQTMYFPPYIKSFSHNSNANWNTINFLGRPEAVYTYNNSTRSGNISFVVLTDFAQKFELGLDENAQAIIYDFKGEDGKATNFSKQIGVDVKDGLQSQIEEINIQISDLLGEDNDDLTKKLIDDLKAQKIALERKLKELNDKSVKGFIEYSEVGLDYENIYNIQMNNIGDNKKYFTKEILDSMKDGLMFQPAFFSGDKADFLNRIEFLEKMARPARAGNSGFSFTNPPICHLRLGDWFHHDIIPKSISYDYSDSVWTLDSTVNPNYNRVQPMWVTISLDFDIVGVYGGDTSKTPPLATDNGGFFQKMK